MPLLYTAVVYLFCGGVLWLLAHRYGAFGQQIPLGRVITVLFVSSMANRASSELLAPLIGYWRILVELAFFVLLIQHLLELSFKNALKSAVVYTTVLTVLLIAVEVYGEVRWRQRKQQTPTYSAPTSPKNIVPAGFR